MSIFDTIGNGLNDVGSGITSIFSPSTSSNSSTTSDTSNPTSSGSNQYGQMNNNSSLWGLPLSGLQTGFGIYSGLKQLSLANKEFKLNRAIARGNFNNSVQQYNTNLNTTAGLRSSMEGTGGPNSQAANDFYNQNKLKGL